MLRCFIQSKDSIKKEKEKGKQSQFSKESLESLSLVSATVSIESAMQQYMTD